MMSSSWWLYVFWCSMLTDLGEGSMRTFRLPPCCQIGKNCLYTKEATQLHSQQAQTRNQDLAAFETVKKKKKGIKKKTI